jgi:hypothetical protein
MDFNKSLLQSYPEGLGKWAQLKMGFLVAATTHKFDSYESIVKLTVVRCSKP